MRHPKPWPTQSSLPKDPESLCICMQLPDELKFADNTKSESEFRLLGFCSGLLFDIDTLPPPSLTITPLANLTGLLSVQEVIFSEKSDIRYLPGRTMQSSHRRGKDAQCIVLSGPGI